MMPDDFESFAAAARADGFTEVAERHWEPNTTVGPHTHPFAVRALVVRGEMWLSVSDFTRHLRPGDTFEIDAHITHAERYGPEGATYWVARRHDA